METVLKSPIAVPTMPGGMIACAIEIRCRVKRYIVMVPRSMASSERNTIPAMVRRYRHSRQCFEVNPLRGGAEFAMRQLRNANVPSNLLALLLPRRLGFDILKAKAN